MGLEKIDTGILVDQNVLDGVVSQYQRFVASHLKTAAFVNAAYLQQIEQGFFQGVDPQTLFDLPRSRRRSTVLSPYNLARLDDRAEPTGVSYLDDPTFAPLFAQIVDSYEESLVIAREDRLPDYPLILGSIEPPMRAFKGDPGLDFHTARTITMNLAETPRHHEEGGFLDTYKCPVGIKLGLQHFSVIEITKGGKYLSDSYNDLVQQALVQDRVRNRRRFTVYVCNVIDFGGMAAENPWSAKAVPTERDIRTEVRTRAFIFRNSLTDIFNNEKKPYLEVIAPRRLFDRADWLDIAETSAALQQAGYFANPIPNGSEQRLRDLHSAFQEVTAELWGIKAKLHLPEGQASGTSKYQTIYYAFAEAHRGIAKYNMERGEQEQGNIKGPIIAGHSALARAAYLNWAEDNGVMQYQGDRMMITSLEDFAEVTQSLLDRLNQLARTGSYSEAESFLNRWAREPRDYLAS